MAEMFPDGPPPALRRYERADAIRTVLEAGHPDYTVTPAEVENALRALGVTDYEIAAVLG